MELKGIFTLAASSTRFVSVTSFFGLSLSLLSCGSRTFNEESTLKTFPERVADSSGDVKTYLYWADLSASKIFRGRCNGNRVVLANCKKNVESGNLGKFKSALKSWDENALADLRRHRNVVRLEIEELSMNPEYGADLKAKKEELARIEKSIQAIEKPRRDLDTFVKLLADPLTLEKTIGDNAAFRYFVERMAHAFFLSTRGALKPFPFSDSTNLNDLFFKAKSDPVHGYVLPFVLKLKLTKPLGNKEIWASGRHVVYTNEPMFVPACEVFGDFKAGKTLTFTTLAPYYSTYHSSEDDNYLKCNRAQIWQSSFGPSVIHYYTKPFTVGELRKALGAYDLAMFTY